MTEDVRSVLTELLRLYNWRNEIGRIERDFNHDKKAVKTMLNTYGREKKAAWEAAVRVLSAPPEVDAPAGGESWLRAQRDTAEERLADTAKAVKAAAKMIEDGMHCSAQLDLEALAGKLEKFVPSPRETQSD